MVIIIGYWFWMLVWTMLGPVPQPNLRLCFIQFRFQSNLR